jgi:hypothetical protein
VRNLLLDETDYEILLTVEKHGKLSIDAISDVFQKADYREVADRVIYLTQLITLLSLLANLLLLWSK